MKSGQWIGKELVCGGLEAYDGPPGREDHLYLYHYFLPWFSAAESSLDRSDIGAAV